MRKLSAEQSILLDAVRGLSALAVLVGHGLTMLPSPPAIGTILPIQSYGVVLFFALSGFLIAYHCMRRTEMTFIEYMIDRFARIFTAFVPAIVLVALLDPLFRAVGDANSVQTFVANLLMLQHTPFDRIFDWAPTFEPFGSGRQFWTIAVEWWLYALFGIFFYAVKASWGQRAVMAMLAPVAVESVAQVWIYSALAAVAFCLIVDTSRVRGLALPMTLFFFVALGYRLWVIWPPTETVNVYDPSFMMLSIGALLSLVFLAADSRVFGRALSATKPLWSWLAWISYSLYLTHQTLQYLWQAYIGVGGYRSFAAMCAASIVVAVAFTWAFDRHHKEVAGWLKTRRLPSLSPSPRSPS